MALHGEFVGVEARGQWGRFVFGGGGGGGTAGEGGGRSRAVDLGPIVVVCHDGLEVWVGQDAHAAVAGGHEDLFAAPAKGDLVGLYGLLVACQRGRLGRREDMDFVRLVISMG